MHVTCLVQLLFPDEGHGTDGHDSVDGDEGDSGRVGDAAVEAEYPGTHRQDPVKV